MPVAEDLFRDSADGPALVGTRCTSCGAHYFPKSLSCRNPGCDAKAVEETLLGRRGTLYSYTVQGYRPPALFGMDPWEPYALGLVELPEGLRVMGMLTGCPLEEIRIDMPVELTVEALYTDDEGRDVLDLQVPPERECAMRPVYVLGVGAHPWGKWPDKPQLQLAIEALSAALADAGQSTLARGAGPDRGQLAVRGRHGLGPARQRGAAGGRRERGVRASTSAAAARPAASRCTRPPRWSPAGSAR